MFRREVDAVMLEQAEEEGAAVVHAGVTAAGDVGDDVGLRESTVDSLAAAAELRGFRGAVPEAAPVDSAAAPASGSAEPRDPAQGPDGGTSLWQRSVFRRAATAQGPEVPQSGPS